MVEHVSIPDAQRHEVKHADAAAINQVLTANGDGTTKFSFLDYATISNRPTASGYVPVLQGQSVAASQLPTTTGIPIQVEFGPAISTADVSLSSAGAITFNNAGQYLVSFFLRFGRSTVAGDAYLFNRILLNNAQALNSNAVRLSSMDIVIPFASTIAMSATAGQVLTMQLLRDGAGVNNGGLYQLSPTTSGWAAAPTATVVVSKFGGLSG